MRVVRDGAFEADAGRLFHRFAPVKRRLGMCGRPKRIIDRNSTGPDVAKSCREILLSCR